MSNADYKRQFLADAIQAYIDRTDDGKLSIIEQFDCKAKYEKLCKAPYLLYMEYPTNGDEYLIYKLINSYTSKYDDVTGMTTIDSRQIVTLYRRGLEFQIEHEADMKGGLITIDLPIQNLRGCDEKEAGLFFKCFDKIEQTIHTDLAWCLAT